MFPENIVNYKLQFGWIDVICRSGFLVKRKEPSKGSKTDYLRNEKMGLRSKKQVG